MPVVPDPPLARGAAHATSRSAAPIPEELYAAVAQVLAYVYRIAGRRAACMNDMHQEGLEVHATCSPRAASCSSS